MMKKIILSFAVLLLLFTNCQKPCPADCSCEEETTEKPDPCKIEYPKDIKPVDWENYNDVYTVYWNYRTVYAEVKEEDQEKEIMVYGWVFPYGAIGIGGTCTNLYLISDKDSSPNQGNPRVEISASDSIARQLHPKLVTADLTKKCFVKGKLRLYKGPYCWIKSQIWITNSDDIYFE